MATRQWTKVLFEGGWICATWPKEYGGKGLSTMEAVVLNEEFAKAGAPMRADFFGDTLVGPTILQWGTEEQKKFFLPKILSGEIAWCQGFSEPDAGSRPRQPQARRPCSTATSGSSTARRSGPPRASWPTTSSSSAAPIPRRPSTRASRTCCAPMKQPGVEVRPIEQVDGSAEFCEVFFTDARCPKDNVVGGVNNGWNVAMTTLGFERGTSATTGYRRFEKELDIIIDAAKANGAHRRPARSASASPGRYSNVQIMRINGLRSLTVGRPEQEGPGRRRARPHQQDVLERVPPAR